MKSQFFLLLSLIIISCSDPSQNIKQKTFKKQYLSKIGDAPVLYNSDSLISTILTSHPGEVKFSYDTTHNRVEISEEKAPNKYVLLLNE